jgi:HNH endonuclease
VQTEHENRMRFWERVIFDDGCWPWVGPRNKRGYGHWKFHGKTRKATRIMWEIFNGPIQNNLHVLHKCDNPSCVNIGHLFLGTHSDNMRDCVSKGRHNPPDQNGENHSGAKLNWEKVNYIRAQLPHRSHSSLAREIGISRSVVTRIAHGLLWNPSVE